MPQQPRVFTDFVPTLQLFIEEELQGEAFFGRLADYHQGRTRHVFQLMAAIESGMIAAMQPSIVRLGLKCRSRAVSLGFKADMDSGAGGVSNIHS